MIIDVDQHDIFQNQSAKRKTFYRKQKYIMNKVGVEEFRRCKKTGDAIVWEEIKKRRIRQYLMIVYCKLKIIKVFIFLLLVAI